MHGGKSNAHTVVFLAMSPETFKIYEGFGAFWSFFSGTYLLPMVGRYEYSEIFYEKNC